MLHLVLESESMVGGWRVWEQADDRFRLVTPFLQRNGL